MIKGMRAYIDRTTIIIIILFIITLIFSIAISIYTKKEERINTELATQLTEMQSLEDRFIKLKGAIEPKKRKIGLVKADGIISILEQSLKATGLKADAVRQLTKNNIEGYLVEDAELEIKDIDLNGIVNILYRIENSPFPLRIKDAFIKTSFDNPNKFIIKLTISFISESGDQRQGAL